jgi:hypothetical protein
MKKVMVILCEVVLLLGVIGIANAAIIRLSDTPDLLEPDHWSNFLHAITIGIVFILMEIGLLTSMKR